MRRGFPLLQKATKGTKNSSLFVNFVTFCNEQTPGGLQELTEIAEVFGVGLPAFPRSGRWTLEVER